MKTFEYVITDEVGIHARPAGALVKKAGEYASNVNICKDGKSADAKRLMGLMGLGVKKGDTIVVNVEGPDEEQAKTELEQFFKDNL